MGHHTFDPERADRLDDVSRYRHVSAEELVAALDLSGAETVLDLGSGTGFYTNDVAPAAGRVIALDIQPAMHELYREKGLPEAVEPVTAAADPLPLADGSIDAAVSTMTYHEFATDAALADLRRALAPGARFVVADWSGDGAGDSGPPVAERYTPDEARAHLEAADFAVERFAERPETFLFVARA
ncbi:MAG: class I SAM-dependent methyltransferase [Salinirussus sp.]